MIRAAVFALLSVLLIPRLVAAQPPSVDPIRELLTEVRALRLAMERQATVGARIQLLVARIQLQEQRIAELSRRAAAVRDELSKIDAGLAASSADLSRMEHELERVTDAKVREEVESNVAYLKAKLARPDKRRQDLMNEEALLNQQLSTDQGRWSDVNDQLDQLERSLTPPKQ